MREHQKHAEPPKLPGKYYSKWKRRHRPFVGTDKILWIEFSQQYFAKLKQELEAAGYEVGADKYDGFAQEDGYWYSEPVGLFGVNDDLPGECFVIKDFTDTVFTKGDAFS